MSYSTNNKNPMELLFGPNYKPPPEEDTDHNTAAAVTVQQQPTGEREKTPPRNFNTSTTTTGGGSYMKSPGSAASYGSNNSNNSHNKKHHQQQQHYQQHQYQYRYNKHQQHQHNVVRQHPADMSILVTRTDLYDNAYNQEDSIDGSPMMVPIIPPDNNNITNSPHHHHNQNHSYPPIAPYRFTPKNNNIEEEHHTYETTVIRVPNSTTNCNVNNNTTTGNTGGGFFLLPVVDKSIPVPYDMDPSMRKYWYQRRRLFSKFDLGIQLDDQGWFSVTPEQIAHHVAQRCILQNINHSTNIILDAFCGCGGNSIAFALQLLYNNNANNNINNNQNPNITQQQSQQQKMVVCIDVDRTKLYRAANNAAIYQIPNNLIVFVECNVLFILEHCYKNGQFVLDQPMDTPEQAMAMMAAMPPPVPTETMYGYQIGGIDLLPRTIDLVFMDPPWGGLDYNIFGKNGYCLEKNMRIPRPVNQITSSSNVSNEGVTDGFFDTFTTEPRNKQERKAAFNCGLDESNCVNGSELLKFAALSSKDGYVVYDIPRNTNKISLGHAALNAGYYGNCKLEEHYLNGRLKTITTYFGTDWRNILLPPYQQYNNNNDNEQQQEQ